MTASGLQYKLHVNKNSDYLKLTHDYYSFRQHHITLYNAIVMSHIYKLYKAIPYRYQVHVVLFYFLCSCSLYFVRKVQSCHYDSAIQCKLTL
jgi:hypothetical protein